MKFNLKNRPKCDDIYRYDEYEAWFEGFEKELRERLTNHDCDEKVCLFSKIIREILGE